jgi:hypothetical protein
VKITEPSPAKLRQPLLELLAGRDDIDEDFPEIDDPPPEPIDPFERWSEADADQGGERVLLLPAERIALLRDVSHAAPQNTAARRKLSSVKAFIQRKNPAHAVVFRAKRKERRSARRRASLHGRGAEKEGAGGRQVEPGLVPADIPQWGNQQDRPGRNNE